MTRHDFLGSVLTTYGSPLRTPTSRILPAQSRRTERKRNSAEHDNQGKPRTALLERFAGGWRTNSRSDNRVLRLRSTGFGTCQISRGSLQNFGALGLNRFGVVSARSDTIIKMLNCEGSYKKWTFTSVRVFNIGQLDLTIQFILICSKWIIVQ